jgi:branched-chain amino acid transport system substrate-binding protein
MKLRRLGALGLIGLFVAVACQSGATPAPTGQPTPGQTAGEPTPTMAEPSPTSGAGEFGEVVIGPGESIVIGTALAITGDVATLGLDSQYGAEIAGDEKNDAGGIMGHEIAWVHEDAGCGQAETGQTAAQSLVTNETLVAVIGTSCSRTAVPAMPVLAQRGITMVSSSNTSPTLTDPTNAEYLGDFYFRTAHNDLVQGAAMATYACEQNWATAATIHDGSTYADNLRQVFEREFAEQCGGAIVSQQAIAVGDREFAGIRAPIAEAAPDLIYMPIFHPEGTYIFQQAAEIPELANTQLASADGMLGSPDVIEQGGAAVEGIIFSGPACAGDDYENSFLPAYREKSGEPTPISVFHCHAYDAANVIFNAIEEVAQRDADGTLRIDRQALRDAIAGTSNLQGLTGNLNCNEYGDCADPNIAISRIENGAYVVFWP